jgi:hypothetical protein
MTKKNGDRAASSTTFVDITLPSQFSVAILVEIFTEFFVTNWCWLLDHVPRRIPRIAIEHEYVGELFLDADVVIDIQCTCHLSVNRFTREIAYLSS